MAEAAGHPEAIPEADRDNPSTVLGPNAYASPVDMAGAYATFADEGKRTPVHMIKEVTDPKARSSGREPSRSTSRRRPSTPSIANTVNYALQQTWSTEGHR